MRLNSLRRSFAMRSPRMDTVSPNLSIAVAVDSCAIRSAVEWLFCFVMLFPFLCAAKGHAEQQDFDSEKYYGAVNYCRQSTLRNLAAAQPGPVTLSPNKQVLCFDGEILPDTHVSLVGELKEGGLFVVRSLGGQVGAAVILADLVRERHATVVVYDYCISACAEYLFIASYQTYVLKDTLVAWHNPQSSDANHPHCTFLTASSDGGPKKLRSGPCREGGARAAYDSPELRQFFRDRVVAPSFEWPPDSIHIRKSLINLYLDSGTIGSDVTWTLHPRHYPRLFKTKIFYEAYPESQDAVDSLVARLGLKIKVLYDP